MPSFASAGPALGRAGLRLAGALRALLLVLLLAAPALAQGGGGDATAAALKALQESGARIVVIPPEGGGDRASAAPAPPPLAERVAEVRAKLDPVFAAAPDLPRHLAEALLAAGGGSLGWLWQAALLVVVGLVGGGLAYRGAAKAGAGVRAGLGLPPLTTRGGRIMNALSILAVAGVAAAAFVAGGSLAVLLVQPERVPERVTALVVMGFVTTVLVARAVLIAVLNPRDGAARLAPFDDRLATALFRQLLAAFAVSMALTYVCFWTAYLPLQQEAHQLLLVAAAVLTTLSAVAIAVMNRRAITRSIRGARVDGEGALAGPAPVLAALWLPAVVFYMLAALVANVAMIATRSSLLLGPVAAPALALVAALVATGVLLVLHDRRMRRRPMRADWSELAEKAAYGVGGLVGVSVLASLWDLYGAEAQAVERGIGILVVLLLSWVAWRATRIAVDERLAEEASEAGADTEGEGMGASASRIATLLPIVRNVILFVIGSVVVMTLLASLGVDIGPLFAGAGVVGLAIGFGAQALIRDIFSGAFFLFDDAFRRGEYVDVGGTMGSVEKISVRSFQLRHQNGMLHTIPFGEIRQLTNYSRDWVVMKLPVRLTYDTDVEKVRKLVKKLGQEMAADPELGPLFLQPPKSQGVVEMEDSAMIMRVKFMTKPGDQFLVRRHVYQRLRDLFAANGIHFAHREVTVRVANAEDEETRRQAALGAVRALEADGAPAKAADPAF